MKPALTPGSKFNTAIPYYAWSNREPGAMTVWAWLISIQNL
ncbi:MAG: hypothetical protein QXN75_07040 [Thermoproteota archaeon]